MLSFLLKSTVMGEIMKKILLFICLCVNFLFVGCSNVEVENQNYYYYKDFIPKYEIENSLNLSLIIESLKIDTEIYFPDHRNYTTAYQKPTGVELSLKNTSSEVTEIVWASSSLDGSPLFVTGQRYIDAGKTSKPNTIFGKNSTIEERIYPSKNIYFNKEWKKLDLKIPSELILKIKQGKKEGFYIIKINSYETSLMVDKIKKSYNVQTEEELPPKVLELVKWRP